MMLCPQEQAMTPLSGLRDSLREIFFSCVLTLILSLAHSITASKPQVCLTL